MIENAGLRNLAYYSSDGKLAALTRRALTGEYNPHGNIRRASCAILPAFGHRRENGKLTPGLCNMMLAKIALALFRNVPIFASFEVDDALRELGYTGAHRLGVPGKYYETRAVAVDAMRAIHRMRLLQEGDVAVLAHPHHMPRADATVQAMLPIGSSTIVPRGVVVPFDAQSSQLRARNEDNWRIYEPLAIVRSAALGWLDLGKAA